MAGSKFSTERNAITMSETDGPEALQLLRRLEVEVAAIRRELEILRYNLPGKDWLTVGEASHYCGVSESNFWKHPTNYGLEPRRFMGKQLYEKEAVYRSISGAKEWAPRRLPGPRPACPATASDRRRSRRFHWHLAGRWRSAGHPAAAPKIRRTASSLVAGARS